MKYDVFVQLCEDINDAPSGHATMEQRRFFRAAWVGMVYPNFDPPENDEIAIRGYEIGTDLRKRFK